jgi:methionyl-tRNA formyltransferase
VRVVVAATAEVAIPTLEWLKQSEHDLIRVVTTPDSHAGRGKSLKSSPVAQWASDNALPLAKPQTDSEMIEAFKDSDIVIAIAYGRIIPANVLEVPRHGFLNLHFSLLPAYRGAAPVQRAIQNGESVTGISIFKIDENLDTGPIYYQERYNIDSFANSSAVLKDLSILGAGAFERVLLQIEEGVIASPQSAQGVSIAPKVSKEETRVDWHANGLKVVNNVRAFTPLPGAWTIFRETILKISEIRPVSNELDLKPGVISINNKKLFVGTSDSVLEVIKLTPSGKGEMLASDWINGARVEPGDIFE